MITKLTIALKADNGKFWTECSCVDRHCIEATKSRLDSTCQFFIVPASSGKVYIENFRRFYLRRVHSSGIEYIVPDGRVPAIDCEFQMHNQDGKVFFMADNGKYLGRIHRSGKDNIEACNEQVDVTCLFEMDGYQITMITQGVFALKADNGHFWSVGNSSDRDIIQAAKPSLDSTCRFLMFLASDRTIYIKTPQNKYLSRVQRCGIDYIEPAKDEPDVSCEFQLDSQDHKVVFVADNGKYLSRVHRSGAYNIEAYKEQIDEDCLFEPVDFQKNMIPQDIIAFKADNGHFWSIVNNRGRSIIKAAKSSLDMLCQFWVLPASKGKIYIMTPQGKYVSHVHYRGSDYIEPTKEMPDAFCEFQLFIQDGKIVLKAHNGKYVSRIRRGGINNIEAAKDQIDEYCLFEVVEFKVASFGILELFINNVTPVAVRTTLGYFWRVVEYQPMFVFDNEVTRVEVLDLNMVPSAKFFIEKGPSGMILFRTPQNKYLSRSHRSDNEYIEVTKDVPDVFCQFLVIQSCKMVLQADNGKYLSHICHPRGDTVQAAKQDIDEFCYFDLVPYSS
ncbi:uncharacterized protein LOC122789938 isoform X2 [Protopterus annectens]|uniref:uncharacterized protein LOC122789938 isoform X2 n=1 Tax=Protopterus annectens TaxID=7888 RepID=UPI001CFA4B9D|nr:uncharacterized protein LOC122789938 isoform X2 [Protopterus annectens]